MRGAAAFGVGARVLAALAIVALLPACNEDGPSPVGDGSSVSATIGPEGGTLALGDEVLLEVPPGALEAPTTITLSRTAEPAFDGWEAYSPVYRFEPEGLQFAIPAHVSVRFAGDADRVELAWRADRPDAPIEHVQTGVEGGRVLGEVSHFTLGMAGIDLDLITEVQCAASPTGLCPSIAGTEPDPTRAQLELTIRGRRIADPSWPRPVVRFGDQVATVRGYGSTWVRVTVPDYARSRVDVATIEGTSRPEAVRLLPFVRKGYPASGLPGSTVTLEGSGLRGATVVFPPGISAETEALDGNLITAVVPEGAQNGALTVFTTLGSWTCRVGSGCDYFHTGAGAGPEIGSVDPPAAAPGGWVRIRGARLLSDDPWCRLEWNDDGLHCPLPEVRIGGHVALPRGFPYCVDPTCWARDDQVDFLVPRDVEDGPVTLTTPDGTATWETFHALPGVSSVEPTCGDTGTPVTLGGTRLDRVASVAFEPNVPAEITAQSATELRTVVPAGFSGDDILLETEHGQVHVPFGRAFPPWVEEVDPTTIRQGERLRVTGRWLDSATYTLAGQALGHGASPGSSCIDGCSGSFDTCCFYDRPQPGGDMRDWYIIVPDSVPAGPHELTVTIACGVRSVPLTIRPGVPRLASFSPTFGRAGTSVTLEGHHLLGVSVELAGTAATVTAEGADRLTVLVPEGARTGSFVVRNALGESASLGTFELRDGVPPRIDALEPARGGSGDRFWVVGSELDRGGSTAVTMSPGVAARITSYSCTDVTLSGCRAGTSVARAPSGRLGVEVEVPAGAFTGPVHVRNGEGETVGPVFQVSRLRVDGFEPDRGLVGDEVVVIGRGLDGAQVTFAPSVGGAIVSSDDLSLRVIVPPGAETGPLRVRAADGAEVETATPFTVLEVVEPPAIRDVLTAEDDPHAARVGEQVTVCGDHLADTAPTIRVGDLVVPAETCSEVWCAGPWSIIPNCVTFLVPPDVEDGPVSVETRGGRAMGPALRLLLSVVDTFPSVVHPLDTVLVSGRRLASASVEVSDGLTTMRPAVLRPTERQLEFVLPLGWTRPADGRLSLRVTNELDGDHVDTSLQYDELPLMLGPPVVTSILPASGHPTDVVRVRGTGLLLPDVLVEFAPGVRAVIDDADPLGNWLDVVVPHGAETGPVAVRNTAGATTGPVFTVLRPTIESFTPDRGPGGTRVDITGTRFGLDSTVWFSGAAGVTPVVDSDTHLHVSVPPTARTGPITVVTSEGSARSATPFSVPASISALSPDHGVAGAVVTVLGLNLTGASRVETTAGATAIPTVLSDTALSFAIPPDAESGPIAVTTPVGVSVSTPLELTVDPPPTFFPSITSVAPTAARVGDEVTIRGANLASARQVLFAPGRPSASLVVVSDSEVRARVPTGARNGPLTVRTDYGEATSATVFTVLPWLDSFSPVRGAPGASVTLAGDSFFDVRDVSFGGVSSGGWTILDDQHLSASVPALAISGPIAVTTGSGTAMSAGSFTVLADVTITSLEPATGPVGTMVTILGTGLADTTEVRFDGVLVGAYSAGPDAVATTVPPGATTGRVTVTSGGVTAVSPVDFVVTTAAPPPVITSFAPPSGPQGSMVRIDGSGFTGTSGLRFNGITATFTVVSDAWINTTVPPGATTGPITLLAPGGFAAGPIDFTVTGSPSITSFSPGSGPAGTAVTLTGSGFTGATALRFNGTAATSWSIVGDTRIDATVPTGATTGRITVVNPAGTGTSATDFTVTGVAPPTITSVRPASGPPSVPSYTVHLLIDGTNLGGATVTLGGVVAPVVADTGTRLTVAVPIIAAGPVTLVVTTPAGSVSTLYTLVMAYPTAVIADPVSGAVGDCVTLSGVNLLSPGGPTPVTINGVSAPLRSTTTLAVTVVVPLGATSGTITASPALFTAGSAPFTLLAASPAVSGFAPSTGWSGVTRVDITGSSLGCASGTVRFGATAATILSWTPTAVAVRAPAGLTPGAYDITLTTYGGASLSVGSFTVQPTPPPPTITSFTPSSGTDGTVVTITGTNLLTTQSVRFGAEGPESTFVVDSDTQVRTTVAPGSFSGPIRLATAGGSTSSGASFTVILLP